MRRRLAVAVAAVALGVLSASTPVYGAPGDLDPTFSGDGRETTDISGFDWASSVVVQPDGKLVAAGHDGEVWEFALSRYNRDGSLDPTFSGDGRVTTDIPGGSPCSGNENWDCDEVLAVALQPDGKLVAAGRGGDSDFALARYNPDGSLDPTFSGDGLQTTDFGGGGFHSADGVVIQPDGKLVAAGGADGDFALARYNPDGSLDPTFSGDGLQKTDFGVHAAAVGVVLRPDGKLVAAGTTQRPSPCCHPPPDCCHFALARYNPDGSLDTTFSGDGRQKTDVAGLANEVVLQPDGKLVMAGSTSAPDNYFHTYFALARYNPDGSLDPTFSGDGVQTNDFAQSGWSGAYATSVALQLDGKLVAAGGVGSRFGLARYNSDASLDTTFSGDGLQTTDFGQRSSGGAQSVALQPDGKLVAAGSWAGDFALARYQGGEPALPPPLPVCPSAQFPGPIYCPPNSLPDIRIHRPATTAHPAGCPQRGLLGIGTDGNDTLSGSRSSDVLAGLGGDDFLLALAAPDCLYGGDGRDRLSGGAGSDMLFGESGSDLLTGAAGNDRLHGQSGGDRLGGGSGADRLFGGSGRDRLSGGSARDAISGGSGADRISGGSGRDRLRGGSGNDRISARDGTRDNINCGAGTNDRATVDAQDVVSSTCETITAG
jgi:uncharacterized delta-60 repeat protein